MFFSTDARHSYFSKNDDASIGRFRCAFIIERIEHACALDIETKRLRPIHVNYKATKMSNPKFILCKSKENGKYYFHLLSNGETLLRSDGFHDKQSCLMGILAAKTHAPIPYRFKRKNTLEGFTFALKGVKGTIVGRSETYDILSDREKAMKAVMRAAPTAPIEDLTRQLSLVNH